MQTHTTDLLDAAGDGCEGGGAHDDPALVAGPLAEVQLGGGPQLQEGRGRGGGAGPALALASARPLAASSLGRGPGAGVDCLLLHQSQVSTEIISTNGSSPAAAAGGWAR